MEKSYVRTEMLPEQDAPSSAVGMVRWVRENLFSGPLNSILTILSIYIVYYIIAHIWPWLSHSVWNAGSLTECREIIVAKFGDGETGACFAVIKARWHQLMFGFYPQDMYWRPVLSFVLMLVALAPILFNGLRVK